MKAAKQAATLAMTVALIGWMYQRTISLSLSQAVRGWRTNPARMVAKIVFSFVVGQGIFWVFGSDQLGLFMDPKVRLGLGLRVGGFIQQRLPDDPVVAWLVKAIEILTDASRIPIEGGLYQRRGYVPDALAAAVTQPAWSAIEAAEKITGVIVHPERVTEPEQVRQSLANIYGSVFRWGQVLLLYQVGEQLYRVIGWPLERLLGRLMRRS